MTCPERRLRWPEIFCDTFAAPPPLDNRASGIEIISGNQNARLRRHSRARPRPRSGETCDEKNKNQCCQPQDTAPRCLRHFSHQLIALARPAYAVLERLGA